MEMHSDETGGWDLNHCCVTNCASGFWGERGASARGCVGHRLLLQFCWQRPELTFCQ